MALTLENTGLTLLCFSLVTGFFSALYYSGDGVRIIKCLVSERIASCIVAICILSALAGMVILGSMPITIK